MATPKITLAKLKELAEEMNTVMGLDPEIDVDEYDDKKSLQDRIVEETKDENDECQIYESDYMAGKKEDKDGEPKFSKNAWAMLSALDVEPVEEEPEPPSEPEKKTPPKKKAPAKKDKSETPDKDKKTKAPAKKDEPKKEKKVRYTRFDSFAAAVKSGIKNVEKLTEKANDLYVKQGGKDNIKESKWAVNVGIQILIKLEIATIEKGMLKTTF